MATLGLGNLQNLDSAAQKFYYSLIEIDRLELEVAYIKTVQ
jgi:hypothetical protein